MYLLHIHVALLYLICHISAKHISIERVCYANDPSITITVSPTVLKEYESQTVTVTWSGVTNPNENDWIGVFSPVPTNYASVTAVKYQWCNISDGYLHTGQGQLNFDLLNMHAEYNFVFFRNGTDVPVLAAYSESISFDNLNEPLQGHLALTSNPAEIMLSWATGYDPYYQYVQWGTKSYNYTSVTYANTYTYAQTDMCGPPASTVGWRDPGYLHSALLQELVPNTQYYYRYGADETGWSPEYVFVSPPQVKKDSNVRIVAFGDMGQGEDDDSLEMSEQQPSLNTASNIMKVVESSHVDFVIHIGDLSYANGYLSEWDQFMSQILPIATRVSYMTSGGNHEIDYPNSTSYYNGTDSGGECGVPYHSRFIMPGVNPDAGIHWYSFNYGNVHVVMMDTEYNFQYGSEQYQFIQNDLAKVNRQVTPWIIFCGHRPMYIDSDSIGYYSADQEVAAQLRDIIEPLLVKYNVNLGLWGHHHSYQRTCPVDNQTCLPDSTLQPPVHVVIGMAGKNLSQNLQPTTPQWIEFIDDQEWGYTIIETSETELQMTFYNNENVIRDQFVLYQ